MFSIPRVFVLTTPNFSERSLYDVRDSIQIAGCIPVGFGDIVSTNNISCKDLHTSIKECDVFVLISETPNIDAVYQSLKLDDHINKPFFIFAKKLHSINNYQFKEHYSNVFNTSNIFYYETINDLRLLIIKVLRPFSSRFGTNVYISWSGSLSRDIGVTLKDLITSTIQSVSVFMSTDIRRGENWNLSISEMLYTSKIAIFCITKENMNSIWVSNELKALNRSGALVLPVLVDVDDASFLPIPITNDVTYKLNKESIYKLISLINNQQISPLASYTLDEVFNVFWQKYSVKFKGRLTQKNVLNNDKYSSEDFEDIKKRAALLINEVTSRKE